MPTPVWSGINPYTDNKELLIVPDAVHTDLYDGGGKDAIPFDKMEDFFRNNLKYSLKKLVFSTG